MSNIPPPSGKKPPAFSLKSWWPRFDINPLRWRGIGRIKPSAKPPEPLSIEHCSLGAAGTTNPITNWTEIFSLPTTELVAEIFKRGRFPSAVLPVFLHELTHHWCFLSPVGSTMALARLRARREAIKGLSLEDGDEREEANWQSVYYALRFRAANEVLRPLSEGLALFAEFDAFPGDSALVSTVAQGVLLWFCGTEQVKGAKDAKAYVDAIRRVLIESRLRAATAKAKLNLLSQPLAYDPKAERPGVRGGYLPGYMAVKNAHTALIRKGCDAASDTDFFLTYVRSYIFEDFGLVAMILAPADNEARYCENLVRYVTDRFADMVEFTTPEDLARFEQRVLDHVDPGPLTGTHSNRSGAADRCQAGWDLLGQMKEDIEPQSDNALIDKLRAQDRWTMAQRQVVCVATFTDPVKVMDGIVTVGQIDPHHPDWFRARFPARPGAVDGRGLGRIQHFIVPTAHLRVMTVALNDSIVAVHFLDGADDDLKQDFVQYITNTERMRDDQRMSDELLANSLQEVGTDEYLDGILSQCRKVIERFYLDCAVMFTEQNSRDQATAQLGKRGFYSLLDSDFSALEGLAIATVAASLNSSTALIARHLKAQGHDLRDITARCELASAASEVPILLSSDEVTYSWV